MGFRSITFGLVAIFLGSSGLTGCTTAVIAGAAAAGGYIAHEKGYRVRSPIVKKGRESR